MSLRYFIIASLFVHILIFIAAKYAPFKYGVRVPEKPLVARLIKPREMKPYTKESVPERKIPFTQPSPPPRKTPRVKHRKPPERMEGRGEEEKITGKKPGDSMPPDKEEKPLYGEDLKSAEKKAIEELIKGEGRRIPEEKGGKPRIEGEGAITFSTKEFKYYGYKMRLKEKIEGVWEYPLEAARQGIYGDLVIRFTILKDGNLGAVELLRTSGYKMLDNAALRALRNAAPFWPLPEEWKEDAFTISGHFIYSHQGYLIR